MEKPRVIPHHLLFACHSKNSLEEARRDTANYYIAHNKFEYEFVTLMEIAHIICIKNSKPLDEYETKSWHNKLCKIINQEELFFYHKDIRNVPYFTEMSFEYWVMPEIAIYLIELVCSKNPIKPRHPVSKNQPKKAKQTRSSKLCPHLLNFLKPYVDINNEFKDWARLFLEKHLVEDSYQHHINTPHERCYYSQTAQLNEVRLAYVQKNSRGTLFLHYYWLIPHNDKKNLQNNAKSFESVKRHFNDIKKHLTSDKTLNAT